MTLTAGDNTTSLSTTGYNYDPSTQRLANISLPGGSYSANYLYFTNSNTASDQINTVEVQPTSGNPITITYLRDPSDLSRLEKVTYSGSQGTAFTDSLVDPSGNGRFNPIDQITGRDMTRTVLATNSGGTIVSQSEDDKYNYGYDPNHGDALTAVYDGNNNNAVLDSYNYDNAGNRTDLGTVNSVNDYGNYTYNARHDQTSEGNLNYGFDAKDRLISETPKVPAEGSIEETMGYDSGNHLMWLDFYQYHLGKWGTGPVESEHFVWDGDQMAAMLDGSNDLLQAYTYGPTGLIAISDYTQSLGNPSTYVVVSDLSGNVQGLLNPDGTVAASYHYGPFGENFNAVLSPALRGVDPNPFGFAGGFTDGLSGLVYFHNRWYSPSQGRFITEDPSGVAGGENTDTYARNDPVNNDDPSGLDAKKITFVHNWEYPVGPMMVAAQFKENDLFSGRFRITKVVDNREYYIMQTSFDDTFGYITLKTNVTRAEALADTKGPWFLGGTETVWYDDTLITPGDKPFEPVMFQQQVNAQKLEDMLQVKHEVAQFADGALHLVPGAPIILDLPEAISGTQMSTGRELGSGERAAALTSVVFTGLGVVYDAYKARKLATDEALTLRILSESAVMDVGILKMEQHHIFPQEFKWWFNDPKNVVPGFNVDSYVVDLPDWYHDVLHAGGGKGLGGGWYNDFMIQALKERRAVAKGPLTQQDVLDVGLRVRQRFEIDHLPIHPYVKN